MRDFDNIYITGDTHADFSDLIEKSLRYGITRDDLLIILGDVGINFFGDNRDKCHKEMLSMVRATILCIHGNHELRPTSPEVADLYHPIQRMGDQAYVDDAYPRIIMASEGARYHINGRDFLVIGGAYSVDKPQRLLLGYRWFPDEQLTVEEMDIIRQKVQDHGNREDIILSHTCPYNNRPIECFLPGLDESTVDNTMEHFMQEIVAAAQYNGLYCGHWHTEKQDGKIQFLFHDVILLED